MKVKNKSKNTTIIKYYCYNYKNNHTQIYIQSRQIESIHAKIKSCPSPI